MATSSECSIGLDHGSLGTAPGHTIEAKLNIAYNNMILPHKHYECMSISECSISECSSVDNNNTAAYFYSFNPPPPSPMLF